MRILWLSAWFMMRSYSWKRKKRSILKGTPESLSEITNRRILLTTAGRTKGSGAVDMSREDREYESWYARKKVSRWQPLWREIYDVEVVAQVESWTPRDKLSLTLAKTSPIAASPLACTSILDGDDALSSIRQIVASTFTNLFPRYEQLGRAIALSERRDG